MLQELNPNSQRGQDVGFDSVWLGCALLASSWCWLRPVYLEEKNALAVGLCLILLSCIVLIIGFGRDRWMNAVALGICLFVTGYVTNEFLIVLEAWREPLVMGMNGIARWICRLAGEGVEIDEGRLLLTNRDGTLSFAATGGNVALRPFLLFLGSVGLVSCLYRKEHRIRQVWIAIGLTAGACVLRYAYSIVTFAATEHVASETSHLAMARMWDPWSVLLAVCFIGVVLGVSCTNPERRHLEPAWVNLHFAGIAGLAGVLLGVGYAWSDPGIPTRGRIVIDDRLSGYWEPAGRLLTPDRFGDFSAYSFSAMVEHLARRLSVEINSSHEYTTEYLANFDVLIIKTPQHPLEPEEVHSIVEWIHCGGGLFAISDHTDLGGMSTALNEVLSPAGIHFKFDSTAAAAGGFDRWKGHWTADHPIVQGLEDIGFMTACSIQLSGSSRSVMTLSRSVTMGGDYSRSSNFGRIAPMPSEPQGTPIVAASSEYGQGRILAFGDSTVFSSFAYFMDSHANFALRGVAWLTRRGSMIGGALKWGWIALGALCAGLWFRMAPSGWNTVLSILAFCSCGMGGVVAAERLLGSALQVPAIQGSTKQIGFVQEGGYAWLPPVLGSQPSLPPHGNYMTFVQVPLRLGFETRVVRPVPEVLASVDVLVLLNPEAEGKQIADQRGWVQAVRSWVERGGRLVVLERRQHLGHTHDAAPSYLTDLSFEAISAPDPDIGLGLARLGEGLVVSVVGSELLDSESLGHCMEYPGTPQLRRYATAYGIFGTLLDLGIPERRTYFP